MLNALSSLMRFQTIYRAFVFCLFFQFGQDKLCRAKVLRVRMKHGKRMDHFKAFALAWSLLMMASRGKNPF